ncbi:MAG: DUF4351 domain-containing protein [Candidatus Sericytochromatia bacterium]|nr:DUF4351 domain-containing protein [Candidatus Sericytochromatia bacterium]
MLRPLVVGPEELPPIAVRELAEANPHLAILAAVAHCREAEELAHLELALEALSGLPAPSTLASTKYPGAPLDARFRALPEVQMKFDPIEFYPQVRAYVEELRSEGRQQEALRVVLRQLGRRIGLPGPEVQGQLEALTTEQLEDLGEALLDFAQPEDLTGWLAAHGRA